MKLRFVGLWFALSFLSLSFSARAALISYNGNFDGSFLADHEIPSLTGNWSASVSESAFEQASQESIDLGGNYYLYSPLDLLNINPGSIGSRAIDLSNTEFAIRFVNGVVFEYYLGATYVNAFNIQVRGNQIGAPDDFRITYRSTDFSDPFADAIINQVTYRVGSGGIQRIASSPSGEFSVRSSISPVPIPAAAWLFGTALFGLIGFSRRRKAAWQA